jgi:hypothetical protein
MRVQRRLRTQPVGDCRKPSRLDEANQVGRDGHTHFARSAREFPPGSGAGFDIAASSVACQDNFIADPSPITCRACRQSQGIGS